MARRIDGSTVRISNLSPGAVEVENKRWRNGVCFKETDGTLVYFIGKNIHREVNGKWSNIDNRLKTSTGKWAYRMQDADYTASVASKFNSIEVVDLTKNGYSLSYRSDSLGWVLGDGTYQPIALPRAIDGEVTHIGEESLVPQSRITWKGAYGEGLDFDFLTSPERFIKHLTVASLSKLSSPVDIVGAKLAVGFTFNTELTPHINEVSWDGLTPIETDGIVDFRDDSGIIHWILDIPYATDDNRKQTACSTRLTRFGFTYRVQVLVPYEWLTTAVFPVVIDPTVNYSASISDGHIYGWDWSYTAANHIATNFNLISQTAAVGQTYQEDYSYGHAYTIWRYFVEFDTSGIDDYSTVTQTNLSASLFVDVSTTDFIAKVMKTSWVNPINIGNMYDNYWSAHDSVFDADWLPTSINPDVDTQYESDNLDTSYVNLHGITQYVIVSDRDTSHTPSTGNEYVYLNSADSEIVGLRPFLKVISTPNVVDMQPTVGIATASSRTPTLTVERHVGVAVSTGTATAPNNTDGLTIANNPTVTAGISTTSITSHIINGNVGLTITTGTALTSVTSSIVGIHVTVRLVWGESAGTATASANDPTIGITMVGVVGSATCEGLSSSITVGTGIEVIATVGTGNTTNKTPTLTVDAGSLPSSGNAVARVPGGIVTNLSSGVSAINCYAVATSNTHEVGVDLPVSCVVSQAIADTGTHSVTTILSVISLVYAGEATATVTEGHITHGGYGYDLLAAVAYAFANKGTHGFLAVQNITSTATTGTASTETVTHSPSVSIELTGISSSTVTGISDNLVEVTLGIISTPSPGTVSVASGTVDVLAIMNPEVEPIAGTASTDTTTPMLVMTSNPVVTVEVGTAYALTVTVFPAIGIDISHSTGTATADIVDTTITPSIDIVVTVAVTTVVTDVSTHSLELGIGIEISSPNSGSALLRYTTVNLYVGIGVQPEPTTATAITESLPVYVYLSTEAVSSVALATADSVVSGISVSTSVGILSTPGIAVANPILTCEEYLDILAPVLVTYSLKSPYPFIATSSIIVGRAKLTIID